MSDKDDMKLQSLADRAPTAGIFFDFDGTLSEIVRLPQDARPLEGAREALETLSQRFAVIAVVSGRSAHQLVEWLGPNIELWGLQGVEHAKDGRVELSASVLPFAGLMQRVLDDARRSVADLQIPGIVVEDKGVMITFHYRAAEDRDRASHSLAVIAQQLAETHDLIIAEGKLALEVRPPIEFSKRSVVTQRSREAGLDLIAFLGDDLVDLPGFDALDELARDGSETIRVAVDSDEVPQELLDRADVVVKGPAGVLSLMQRLVELTGR